MDKIKLKLNENKVVMAKPNGFRKYYELQHRINNNKYQVYIKKNKKEEYILNKEEMEELLEFIKGVEL